MIYLIQCLCPVRHAIAAIAFDPVDVPIEEMEKLFPEQVERWVEVGALNPRCAMCGNAIVKFHYEVGLTQFRTMEEAKGPLKEAERQQMQTNEYFRNSRN